MVLVRIDKLVDDSDDNVYSAAVLRRRCMLSRNVLLLALVWFAGPVFAEEEESPWSGKVTLGYLATSGNTENSNLNSGFEIGYAPNL